MYCKTILVYNSTVNFNNLLLQSTIYPHSFSKCLCTQPQYRSVSEKGIEVPDLGHGLFPWQSSVVEGVHVDDLFCFHYDRWLGFVF